MKTPERRQWRGSGIFIVNFEHISHLFLEFLLLTLNKQMLGGYFFFSKLTLFMFSGFERIVVEGEVFFLNPTEHSVSDRTF